jgi:hypothetical protein
MFGDYDFAIAMALLFAIVAAAIVAAVMDFVRKR